MQWRKTMLVCVALLGCGQSEVSRETFEADRPAGRLAKIDNGDGTYSYALPEDFDPTQLVRGKIITWRYAGQARHAWAPKTGGERTFTVPERTPTDDRERLLATRRVDAQGRVWEVEDIDDEAWARSLQRAREEEGEPTAVRAPDAPDSRVPGTTITWQPTSWDHFDCDSNNDTHIWNGDGRNAQPNPLGRQRTGVQIDNGSSNCSGVLLDNDEVLTAAHCVSDDDNNPLDVNDVMVCKPDPWACISAEDIDFSTSYGGGSGDGGGTDFDDDWAVIELIFDFPEADEHQADHMHMSTAENSVLEGLANIHNLSFPSFLANCGSTADETVFHNVESEGLTDAEANRIQFRIDGSPGQSGSPFYYCPDGDNDVCGPGEWGWVVSVWAGWNPVSNRFVGPKSADFMPQATAFIED